MLKLKTQLFAYADLNGSSSATSSINVNVTNQNTGTSEAPANDLTIGMKTYYDTELLENARAELKFAQFGRKQGLPKGRGKTIEWRKWNEFPRAQAIVEGITPNGQRFGQTNITAEIQQFGDYATFSDVLETTYYDPIILGATEEFGSAGGNSEELEIRDTLLTGTNIVFAPKSSGTAVSTRTGLDATCLITPSLVNKIVTMLKKNNVPKINGDYIALIHPSVAMDLRESQGWLNAHQYARPEEIYNGEIGKLHGVRFIESTNAKVWGKGAWAGATPTAEEAATKSGLANLAVYATTFLGKDAFGIVDPAGSGMEMIIKQKGSAGTADPLNQRSTVGYKFSTATAILYPSRMIRLESVSSFGGDDTTN